MTTFFTETFPNNSYDTRGWYGVSGSGSAIDTGMGKWNWTIGNNVPTEGFPSNHMFGADQTTASESIYLTFDIKLGTSWNDTMHLFTFMTDAQPDPFWDGSSPCLLQVNCQVDGLKPSIYSTDGVRVVSGTILGNSYPHSNATPSLLGTSEAHAVMGGNGFQSSTSGNGYFLLGGENQNNAHWEPAGNIFVTNQLHSCAFYVQMNSFSGGVPQADGILKYWVDGVLVLSFTDIYLRSPGYETQKFCRLLLSPYLANGANGTRALWLDNVVVGDTLPPASVTPATVPPGCMMY